MIDINSIDQEDSTCITIALKNKHVEIAKYFFRNHGENLDIMTKSKKLGNCINLAMKL